MITVFAPGTVVIDNSSSDNETNMTAAATQKTRRQASVDIVGHGSQDSIDQSMDEQKINREIMNNQQQQSLTAAVEIPC